MGTPKPKKTTFSMDHKTRAKLPKSWNVYVSGFCDWPDTPKEAKGFNPWQCSVNPSGRLFIKDWYKGKTKPIISGPLPTELKKIDKTTNGIPINWTFELLPTRWGVANTINTDNFNVVINLGYGVYGIDNQNKIYLEKNAFNSRGNFVGAGGKIPGASTDLNSQINSSASTDILKIPKNIATNLSKTSGIINQLEGQFYSVKIKGARQNNNYICNETHYLMLKKIETSKKLRQAYFIHIPKPIKDAQYITLARELGAIIENLLQPVDL